MHSLISHSRLARTVGWIKTLAILLAVICAAQSGFAQDTPLLSGGVGFLTSTNGGKTNYQPLIEPLLAAPIGKHFLIESRAALAETFSPSGHGYQHSHFIALTYLEGDYFATPHITVVGGSFLLPFNVYNERLSPIWISNFQDLPLITSLGLMDTYVGVGGMLRGSAISTPKYSIDYAGWFSARSANEQFPSERSSGGRLSVYFPGSGVEAGLSYDRRLQRSREHFYGAFLWWEPVNTSFRLRSEFARGFHAQGYWAEADYRIQAFGGLDSWIGRLQPAFRMQQSFRRDTIASDGLPLTDTQRADFALDYNLPHNVRILTSYSRQFSASGNVNIWETGIVYRFLFPIWKAKAQ